MATATVSEDGKVTIPETIREEAGLAAGDKVILQTPGQRPISVEEMNDAMGDAIAEKYQRVLNQSKKQS